MICALALLVVAGSAHAEGAPLLEADADASKRHATHAASLYDEGRYDEAADEFARARALVSLPAFDYNIGRCYDRIERWADALVAYERYLAEAPSAVDAGEVRERVFLLRLRVGATQPRTGPRPLRVAAWTLAGLAIAAAAAGTGAYLSAYDRYRSTERDCPCTDAAVEALRPQVERAERSGYALWGIAGAAAVADIVVWAVDARAARADARRRMRGPLR